MKWYKLWEKIGKQHLNKISKTDVTAIIDGEEVLLELKFKKNGEPYLVKIGG